MTARKLNWGLLAAGGIARAFAKALPHSKTGNLLAVASRSQEKADEFGKEFGIARCHGSYEALLADPEVDAVYISTPHPAHAEWAVKAAEAGKHILCEKPIGMNHPETMAIVEAARAHDVFLMEAFMYRCHPQTAKLVELLHQRAIGDVRVIQATFSFNCGNNPTGRLLANDLGGGGILDVGCYCTSMARLVAGAALGGTFAEPTEVKGLGHLGATGVDEWATATMQFPGDILATLSTGVQVNQESVVRIFGSEGNIYIPSPWIVIPQGGTTKIIVHRHDESGPREIVIETNDWLYAIEADTVAANLDKRQASFPAMSWDDSLGNMLTLDRWRHSFGFTYQQEQPERVQAVHRRPLKRAATAPIPRLPIPGLNKPLSRLVMGVDNQFNMPHAAAMFDDFFERGGNAFDTAHIYGGGVQERLLGQWIKNRGIRDEVVILGKGAHTPNCNPAALTAQLHESLGRLGTDHLDIYMMHRDNEEIPVGEFVDCMNENQRAGRMTAFGVSNWSLGRIIAANDYAKKNGLAPIAAVSNQFSLARMMAAVWDGCLSASDDAFVQWLTQSRMPLLPWSSQARGFFTEISSPDDLSNGDLVRCWYSDDNFKRKERATELAAKRGVLPINIALAWVLNQPFPTFPLIGPRTLAETTSSLPALGVGLSEEEMRWLDLAD